MRNNLLSAILAAAFCVSCQVSISLENFDKIINDTLDNTDSVLLSDLTLFDWDEVYFIGSYASPDLSDISRMPMGAKRALWKQANYDNGYLLMFVKDNAYIRHALIRDDTYGRLFSSRGNRYCFDNTMIIPYGFNRAEGKAGL